MLKNGHAWLDLGVNRLGQASNLDFNKVLGTNNILCTCTVVEGEVIASSLVDGAPLKKQAQRELTLSRTCKLFRFNASRAR
jgi:hypothetical protein